MAITPLVQRRKPPGEETLQAEDAGGKTPEVTSAIENRIDSLKGGGAPLPQADRSFFEPRFGSDFSAVRVHSDAGANDVASSVHARAFTVGRDIVFGAGEYRPGTSSGNSLLAHELTHVVQQTGSNGTISRQPTQIMRTDSACTPAAGVPPTACSPYAANDWWLPPAYVNNATCACSETPDEPTANCVRKFLQDRLAATPLSVKTTAASMKPMAILNPAAYQAFVQAFLTPRIYQDHVDAYRSCCCPSGPAPYPAWIGVTSVPLPCPAVGWSIRQFGSCHGTPGSW